MDKEEQQPQQQRQPAPQGGNGEQAPQAANGEQRRRYSLDEIADATARAVVPRDLDDVWNLAERAAKSGLFGVRSAEDAFVRIVTGAELGVSSYTALRTIAVFNGKPVLDATLIAALCQRSRDCLRWQYVEKTDQRCTIETHHRRDGVIRHSFTIQEAKDARLLGKDNWKYYPAAMLRARCISSLAKLAYPDVVAGVYTPEEMEQPLPDLTDGVASRLEADTAQRTTDALPTVEELQKQIDDAETLDALKEVSKAIRAAQMPPALLEDLRSAYSARKKELRAATPDAEPLDALKEVSKAIRAAQMPPAMLEELRSAYSARKKELRADAPDAEPSRPSEPEQQQPSDPGPPSDPEPPPAEPYKPTMREPGQDDY